MKKENVDDVHAGQIYTRNAPRSPWTGKGLVTVLVGVLLALIGYGLGPSYWAGFLQTAGAVLAAAGLFASIHLTASY